MFAMPIEKISRVKTKQPMIITDTPLLSSSSFNKVAMDIVGSLPKTERGNESFNLARSINEILHENTRSDF